jgi:hypothetical protein
LTNKKVRVNSKYRYNPVFLDKFKPAIPGALVKGDIVKVVNKFGCPPANTMGMAYVEKDGKFCGMVCCNSLEDLK